MVWGELNRGEENPKLTPGTLKIWKFSRESGNTKRIRRSVTVRCGVTEAQGGQLLLGGQHEDGSETHLKIQVVNGLGSSFSGLGEKAQLEWVKETLPRRQLFQEILP